jgi:hypothetical protein
MNTSTQRAIHRVETKNGRSGSAHGYAFSGWEYEEGWLISFWLIGRDPVKTIWVDSPTAFYSVPRMEIDRQRIIEINPEPIELTDGEKEAVISMMWRWEILEPLTAAGTCMVESLAKALDLSNDDVLDMFRRARCDPSILEDATKTLEENGYKVDVFGPNGFGYRESRRLVTMVRKDDPKSGHAVLIFENDQGLFDSDGIFKQVGDLLFSNNLGYDMGSVLIIKRK